MGGLGKNQLSLKILSVPSNNCDQLNMKVGQSEFPKDSRFKSKYVDADSLVQLVKGAETILYIFRE